jgi:hypothetical protein
MALTNLAGAARRDPDGMRRRGSDSADLAGPGVQPIA